MKAAGSQRQHLTKQFVYFASRVSAFFPDLDLRFNLQGNSTKIRYSIPDVSKEVFELSLGGGKIEELIHEATFAIKEAAGRYDA